jgi:squalene synthase HpnC
MPESHYENFPVASLLLPAQLREPVAAIYAFARSADDLADEGSQPPAERLRALDHYRRQLDAVHNDSGRLDPIFERLQPVVARYDLPLGLFHDLLDAFSQDVHQQRYTTFEELMAYCRRSANPVGRLLLCLFGTDTPANRELSDAICSALQLINHWQDVAIDWRKGRIYLPAEDLDRFGVAEQDIATGDCNDRWLSLMQFQVARARRLMDSGKPLGRRLPGRVGMEIRAIVAGGLRLADKLDAVRYDVFHHRPTLQGSDWLRVFAAAL